MKNTNIELKLNTYNKAGQIVTIALSVGALAFLLPFIISRAPGQVSFPFVTLSVFSLTIPLVLFFTVGKTLVIYHSCRIDLLKGGLSIVENNKISGNAREMLSTSLSGLNELVVIRIKQDEEEIANQYHIFAAYGDSDPLKLFTFTKYHFALRFFLKIEESTELSTLDWSEKTFDRESDFIEYYLSNKSGD